MPGKFEGFSVNGGAGDGFSDDDPLGATEGAVEGIRVGVVIVGDKEENSVGWLDGLTD